MFIFVYPFTLIIILTPHHFRNINPIKTGLYIAAFSLPLMWLYSWFITDMSALWTPALGSLILYSWAIVIFGFFSTRWLRYALRAVIAYFFLMLVLGVFTYFLSHTLIFSFHEYRSMLLAVTLFFGMGLVISRIIRSLADFFEIRKG